MMRNVSYNGFWGLNKLLKTTSITKTYVTPEGVWLFSLGF